MLLSRNSKDFSPEYFKMLAQAGWQAIDINETEDYALFCQPADVQLNFLKAEIDNIIGAGLIANQCHAPMIGSYKDVSDEELDSRICCIEQAVLCASKLKIPYTVVHPLVYSWSLPDPNKDKTWEKNIKYLTRVCAKAENTVICLENMPREFGFIKTAKLQNQLINDVGNNLCACFDTGHAASSEQTASSFFDTLGDKIKVLHVHDSLPTLDKHYLPYLGSFNWEDFKQSLKTSSYKGTLNSESSFSAKLPKENLGYWESVEVNVFKTLLQ